MLNKLNFQSFLSDYLEDKMLKFIGFSSKSPISWLKSAIMKMLKIGLNKLLFKNKKIRNKCGNIKNGARYYAIIGLNIAKSLGN